MKIQLLADQKNKKPLHTCTVYHHAHVELSTHNMFISTCTCTCATDTKLAKWTVLDDVAIALEADGGKLLQTKLGSILHIHVPQFRKISRLIYSYVKTLC